jgi:hypothetical protein
MNHGNIIFLLLLLASCNQFRFDKAPTFSLTCPTGFIGVPGSTIHGTSDFCVMQFEAKNDGSNNAISQASGTPYVRPADDTVGANNNDAFEKCANMSELGFSGTFALISNNEWMTIARDIEAESSNWSSGSVGTGYIPRGHSDGGPGNTLAVTSISDPYDGTLQATGDQKRTHMLSSNLEIWDFAGNISESVDWSSADGIYTTAPNGCTNGVSIFAVHEFSEIMSGCSDGSDFDDVFPAGGYTSAQSFGTWYTGGAGGAATFRGGSYANGLNAGVFGLNFGTATTMALPVHGFRCVYRP